MSASRIELRKIYDWLFSEGKGEELINALASGNLVAEGRFLLLSPEMRRPDSTPLRMTEVELPAVSRLRQSIGPKEQGGIRIGQEWWTCVGLSVELQEPSFALSREVGQYIEMMTCTRARRADVENMWPEFCKDRADAAQRAHNNAVLRIVEKSKLSKPEVYKLVQKELGDVFRKKIFEEAWKSLPPSRKLARGRRSAKPPR